MNKDPDLSISPSLADYSADCLLVSSCVALSRCSVVNCLHPNLCLRVTLRKLKFKYQKTYPPSLSIMDRFTRRLNNMKFFDLVFTLSMTQNAGWMYRGCTDNKCYENSKKWPLVRSFHCRAVLLPPFWISLNIQ